MSEAIEKSAKTLAEIIKEQGLAVVLCVVLIGFVLWSNYTQSEERRGDKAYQREQSQKLMDVVSANTSAMETMAAASAANTQAVEALRAEIRAK